MAIRVGTLTGTTPESWLGNQLQWDLWRPSKHDGPTSMPAGSLSFFVGILWHAGGANRSTAARACVAAQYCAAWCRPQENFSLSISRERVAGCSEHIQRMLGYSIHPPFMAFVNGMHPKRVLSG